MSALTSREPTTLTAIDPTVILSRQKGAGALDPTMTELSSREPMRLNGSDNRVLVPKCPNDSLASALIGVPLTTQSKSKFTSENEESKSLWSSSRKLSNEAPLPKHLFPSTSAGLTNRA
mmetsp:Transcript_20724/g.30741  ORF Transcript_20724/g.30741 Transcript_20724/m.30741 type:complete len:119 (-) Transcript_20724:244-600(-)